MHKTAEFYVKRNVKVSKMGILTKLRLPEYALPIRLEKKTDLMQGVIKCK